MQEAAAKLAYSRQHGQRLSQWALSSANRLRKRRLLSRPPRVCSPISSGTMKSVGYHRRWHEVEELQGRDGEAYRQPVCTLDGEMCTDMLWTTVPKSS